MKVCVECKHIVYETSSTDKSVIRATATCGRNRPKAKKDAVTGDDVSEPLPLCRKERMPSIQFIDRTCGPEGRHFEKANKDERAS